jgi:hypothetical protein
MGNDGFWSERFGSVDSGLVCKGSVLRRVMAPLLEANGFGCENSSGQQTVLDFGLVLSSCLIDDLLCGRRSLPFSLPPNHNSIY